MKVLLCPVHTHIDSGFGGEVGWAYNILMAISKLDDIEIDAICGKCFESNLPHNIRVHEVGHISGDALDRATFYFKTFRESRKLVGGSDFVHHMFPFGYLAGFEPLTFFKKLGERPLILGPIQYPQALPGLSDYMLVSGKDGKRAALDYSLENALRSMAKPVLTLAQKQTLDQAKIILFDSLHTVELYRQSYPDILINKKMMVIPPGIETNLFEERPLTKHSTFNILSVGFMLERKGFQYLIEAVSILKQKGENVKLRLIGEGPWEGELRVLVQKLGLESEVLFLGKKPRSELATYYADCDVFVQPSLSDTFTSAIREAMSMGRPVIASEFGFVSEHLMENKTGYVVPKADASTLADRLQFLINNPTVKEEVGRGAAAYARKVFDWSIVGERWRQVYAVEGL